jgi:hypothetical protein
VVGPLIAEHRPDLVYAAGRLGSGSDVLGLDDERSRDHDWGLRLTLLVDDDEAAADIRALLEAELPETFDGLPARFPTSWDPTPTHKVDVARTDAFVESRLGLHPDALDDPAAWLRLTGQSVLEVTAGPVFHDAAGTISAIRAKLAWYPTDIWFYVLASSWRRLSQELPFVGRCGDVGDDLGSRVIAARLARDVMHVAFLVERVWPPYPKWLGTRFAQLDSAGSAAPALARALAATGWSEREAGLAEAIEAVHARQRQLGLPSVDQPLVPFWDRPYRTINDDLVAVLTAAVTDPVVAALPLGVGSIEQRVDNVDILSWPARR